MDLELGVSKWALMFIYGQLVGDPQFMDTAMLKKTRGGTFGLAHLAELAEISAARREGCF